MGRGGRDSRVYSKCIVNSQQEDGREEENLKHKVQ